MKIPEKVVLAIKEDSDLKWIESQDRLYYDVAEIDQLKIENQYKFWRTNCSIRAAFYNIELEIKAIDRPSVRLAGWSEIARKAKCDRNTLLKSERYKWVSEKRTLLLKLIEEKLQTKAEYKLEPVASTIQTITQLENELKLSKEECSKWFVKYERLLNEHKMIQLAFEREMKRNSILNEEIMQLRKQIIKIVPSD